MFNIIVAGVRTTVQVGASSLRVSLLAGVTGRTVEVEVSLVDTKQSMCLYKYTNSSFFSQFIL